LADSDFFIFVTLRQDAHKLHNGNRTNGTYSLRVAGVKSELVGGNLKYSTFNAFANRRRSILLPLFDQKVVSQATNDCPNTSNIAPTPNGLTA
jgi:hypothetical protein